LSAPPPYPRAPTEASAAGLFADPLAKMERKENRTPARPQGARGWGDISPPASPSRLSMPHTGDRRSCPPRIPPRNPHIPARALSVSARGSVDLRSGYVRANAPQATRGPERPRPNRPGKPPGVKGARGAGSLGVRGVWVSRRRRAYRAPRAKRKHYQTAGRGDRDGSDQGGKPCDLQGRRGDPQVGPRV